MKKKKTFAARTFRAKTFACATFGAPLGRHAAGSETFKRPAEAVLGSIYRRLARR